jgi:hypothetical protein
MAAGVCDIIASMQGLAAELIASIDTAPMGDMAKATGELQRLQNMIGAAASRLAMRVDASGVWDHDGFRSAGPWLALHSGERSAVCSRRVRQARQLSAMPTTARLVDRGVLTADQLRLLCEAQAAAPDRYGAETDATFATLAAEGGTQELGVMVREWKARADAESSPDPAQLPPLDAAEEFRLHGGFDGWWNGSLHLSPDDGAMLNTLIDGEVDGYLRAARDGDPSVASLPMGALRAKALMDLVTRAARRAPGEVSAPDRYRVAVIFPHDADTTTSSAPCDSDLYRIVLGADSEPLDVGRSTKRWSTAIRRAVTHRDGHCTFPGCDRPPSHCDLHHCTHWSDGGDTATTNGTLLCRHHHTFIHGHRWRVHLDHRQRPVFTKPDGTRHELVSQRPRC